MKRIQREKTWGMSRREFLQTVGTTTAGISVSSRCLLGAASAAASSGQEKKLATVRGAFVYPPTAEVAKTGYYSWPGSSFDPEGRQKEYMKRLRAMESKLGMRIVMDEQALDEAVQAGRIAAYSL
jgi:hypothetical protein